MKNTTILLMHGYIGFGKTTIAKKLQELLGYKRFTHDEYMSRLFGDHPSNEEFISNYNKATEIIFKEAQEEINNGNSIILDFGFWSKKDRQDIVNVIKMWNDNITFLWVNVECPIEIARQRCIDRDSNRKQGELWVPVEVFDMKLNQFEPMDECEFPCNRLDIKTL